MAVSHGSLSRLTSKYATQYNPELSTFVNYRPLSNQPFHRWFRYREGYAPQLINFSVDLFGKKPDLVLDPFCGCGTTLLAAKQLGIPSVGFDINPVSVLVARVKTRNYSSDEKLLIREIIPSLCSLHQGMPTAPIPGLNIIDKVFEQNVLNALLAARYIIDAITDTPIREFFLVGWLSILETVSNVFKEGNGIKYKNRKRTPNGYIELPAPSYEGNEAFDLVNKHLAEQFGLMLEDLLADTYASGPACDVYEESALDVSQHVSKESVSLTVFSPPYCNNFNYMKIYKVELWMGAFIDSYAGFRELNKRALRSHVETAIELPTQMNLPVELMHITEALRERELWNKKIPDAVLAYFLDMKECLQHIWNVSKNGSQCHIVVGNSAYSGIVVPSDLLLADIASSIGFEVQELIVTRHLTTSSQQRIKLGDQKDLLRETIVVLYKP